jgi:uncharacterized membrane protein YgdD (TMEM256/DUF423 family)
MNHYARLWIGLGALFGLLAVAIAAFGSHGLAQSGDATRLFDKALRYQSVHALALLAVGLLSAQSRSALLMWSGFGFTMGILCFSGSLLLLALTNVTALGWFTPVGGLSLMSGWGLLLLWAMRGSGNPPLQ